MIENPYYDDYGKAVNQIPSVARSCSVTLTVTAAGVRPVL
jgi:hypothetical protein